jgi:hypothetical protein
MGGTNMGGTNMGGTNMGTINNRGRQNSRVPQ